MDFIFHPFWVRNSGKSSSYVVITEGKQHHLTARRSSRSKIGESKILFPTQLWHTVFLVGLTYLFSDETVAMRLLLHQSPAFWKRITGSGLERLLCGTVCVIHSCRPNLTACRLISFGKQPYQAANMSEIKHPSLLRIHCSNQNVYRHSQEVP